jgi:choice-of-anchor A domain-containing protein
MLKYASLAVAISIAAAAPAAAGESVTDVQLYVLGDLTMNGDQLNQRAAVGGNATFTSTSISGAGSAYNSSLVVGGDLSYLNGGSITGGAQVGGANYAPSYMTVSAGLASLPVDFDVENLRLKNLSANLAAQAATGVTELKWGSNLYLTGSGSGLNVFTVDAATLAQASVIKTDLAPGSQVLINVVGDVVNLKGGLSFDDPSNVLWNFAGANQITAGGLNLSGSVLAPNAAFFGNYGSISGDLVVGSFKGAISLKGNGYGGDLLTPPTPPLPGGGVGAVPEPGVWALMILGFGAVGAMLRRRRGRTLAAAVA